MKCVPMRLCIAASGGDRHRPARQLLGEEAIRDEVRVRPPVALGVAQREVALLAETPEEGPRKLRPPRRSSRAAGATSASTKRATARRNSSCSGLSRKSIGSGRAERARRHALTFGRPASASFTFSAGYSKSSSLPARYRS